MLLCAGAYNSPQILMLSGFGDPAAMQKVGIEPIHEQPGVGSNLHDHLYLALVINSKQLEFSFHPENWENE